MKTILRYYVRVWMLLFPLVFLPVVTDAMGWGKIWVLGVGAGVGMLIWLLELLLGKREKVQFNRFFGWYVVLAIWSVISFWRMGVGQRMASLFSLFGLGTVVIMGMWMFLWLQTSDEGGEPDKQVNWLTGAGLLLAVLSVGLFLIPASKLPWSWPESNPMITLNSGWSLTGALLAETVLMLFLASEWMKRVGLRMKKNENYWMEVVIAAVLVLAIGLDIYRVAKAGWVKLDRTSGWIIAAETFKRSPVWGMGVGRFNEAFSKWRPVSYNGGKYWSAGFNLSSSWILQIWTELGSVGIGVMLVMLALMLGRKKNKFEFWQELALWVGVMLLPWDVVSGMLIMWLLATSRLSQKSEARLVMRFGEGKINVAPVGVGLAVVAVGVVSGLTWVKMVRGEWYLRQSILAAAKNNGGETYNLQIKAIGANPDQAEYRRLYSQTNLALAMTLLQNKDITDEDRQKVAVLVQQAVRESKAAVALDNQNAFYWTNLAVIYRQLIGLVEGTADWSFQAYAQATVLDPMNVLTKLDMGGLLYAAGRYADAERVFEQVVSNKQDYANGWYNWAHAAKQEGKLNDAIMRLQQSLLLVPVDSGDYDKATAELTVWRKEYDDLVKKQGAATPTTTSQPETLKTPEPLPTVGKEEKVNVPASELEPPSVEVPAATQEP